MTKAYTAVEQMYRYDSASDQNFHLFELDDSYFLLDIEAVNVFEIPSALYWKINAGEKSLLEVVASLPKDRNVVASEEYLNSIGSENPTVQALTNISLNVAQICNLSCIYCYGIDGEYGTKGKMPQEIAFESVDFLIKESLNAKNISITFFGGEPLLNFPLIKEVVPYARQKAKEAGKKISFSITTNGTLFNDEINAYLNVNNFSVIISFDGDPETQDTNRPFQGGKGSYDKILPRVKKFLETRNGNATARATLTNHSKSLKKIKQNLKDIGFQRAGATVVTASDFALSNRDLDVVNMDQHLSILQDYEEEAKNFLQSIKNRSDNIKDFTHGKIFRFLTQLVSKNKVYHPCGVGRKMVGISITGDVYPCHRFVGDDKFKMGNVKDFDTESRAKYSESYTQSHPVCSNCWAKYFCGGGGCIQDNEVMKGATRNINTRWCEEIKHQVKLAVGLYRSLEPDDREFLLDYIQ